MRRLLPALLLGLAGCVQILGLEEPSGGPGAGLDGGTFNPGMDASPGFMDGSLNTGQCADLPMFTAETNYGVLQAPDVLAVGDLDHDGFNDVAVGSSTKPGAIFILHGQGGPSLGEQQNVTLAAPSGCTMAGATSLAIGDFDGNGYNDLVYMSGVNCMGHLMVRRQNSASAGQFLAEQPVLNQIGSNRCNLVTARIDSDALDDVAFSCDGTVAVFQARADILGQFTAGFSDTMAGGSPMSEAHVADLNGDNLLDLGWPTDSGVTYVLQNASGTGSFGAPAVVGAGLVNGWAPGKLDGDSLNDVILMSNPPNAQIFLQNPTNHALQAASTVQIPDGRNMQILDINHDTRNDIVTGGFMILQCKSPAPAGSFPTEVGPTPSPLTNVGEILWADLDGDGKLDALGLDMQTGLLHVALQK